MRNELDALVRQMVDGGILYREALTQFKRVFIGVALRDNAENKSKTARLLGMHRNTFIRTVIDLGIKWSAVLRKKRQQHGAPREVRAKVNQRDSPISGMSR